MHSCRVCCMSATRPPMDIWPRDCAPQTEAEMEIDLSVGDGEAVG